MPIHLDTSIMPRNFQIGAYPLDLLNAIAEQLDQDLELCSVAWEESVADCERECASRFDKLRTATENARVFAELPDLLLADPDTFSSRWRQDLSDFFKIIELDVEDAMEALRREAWRIAPTRTEGKDKHGVGARDAAIWLTVKRRHLALKQDTYFIARNPKDFGRDGRLRPELAAELGSEVDRFHLFESVESLLQHIGEELAEPVEAADMLRGNDQTEFALWSWLETNPLPSILRSGEGFLVFAGAAPYVAQTRELGLTDVSDARLYQIRGRHVLLVWSHWVFTYDVEYMGTDTTSITVSTECDFRLSVRLGTEMKPIGTNIVTWRNPQSKVLEYRPQTSWAPVEYQAFDLGDEIDPT